MNNLLVIIGPVLALVSSLAVGILVYRRGMKSDEIAKQAGIATDKTASIGQVVDGLNSVIAALQNDNQIVREELKRVKESVAAIQARIEAVEKRGIDLLAENVELRREVASLHAENEALKKENKKLTARILELENSRVITDT